MTSPRSKRQMLIPSIFERRRIALPSPLAFRDGRSVCDGSPATTHWELKPRRVRNMSIWSSVVFCASSRMMKELLSVRPRMNASGASSIMPRSVSVASSCGSIMSRRASWSGRRYGLILSSSLPGRKPRFSPASTAGRARMMRSRLPVMRALTAIATAR